jgi:D-lyxose ketol-isomerase
VPVPRFPEIIEDELPLHLLCSDYDKVLGLA